MSAADVAAVGAAALSPKRWAEDAAAIGREQFDVLVIGGGVVGSGIALDAATRGLRVAIVEAQDWAAGTSSRSSKLIHGGLRYLATRDLALVREALRERSVLRRIAPHLVTPLPFIYPIRHRVTERIYVSAGVGIYDALARISSGSGALPMHRPLTRRRVRELAPALRPELFVGGVRYFDAQVDDARYTLAVLRTAVSHGAIALNRARVVRFSWRGDAVVGAVVRLVETGEEVDVGARVVVSAAGVWTEQVERLAGTSRTLRVQPSKGVHLVISGRAIDSSTAVVVPTDRSVLFILPWGEHWLVGTTDTPWAHDLARPAATASDIAYLLETANAVLATPIQPSDIESVYVGLRPLIAGAHDETTKLSREHAVNAPRPGLVLVSGGKFTTYRVTAKDALDVAVEQLGIGSPACVSAGVTLVGAEGFETLARDNEAVARDAGLPIATVDRLFHRYGSLYREVLGAELSAAHVPLADAPGYLRAEVSYAVTHEGARHIDDVLSRRTRAAIESADRAVGACTEVSAIMAPLLGWDAATRSSEIDAYLAQIAAELAGERELDDAAANRRLTEPVPHVALP